MVLFGRRRLNQLEKLTEHATNVSNISIHRKRSENGDRSHNVIFVDVHARPQRIRDHQQLVKTYDYTLMHSAYSPRLVPVDYYLLASIGHVLSQQRFSSYEKAKKWLDDWFAAKDGKIFGATTTNFLGYRKNVLLAMTIILKYHSIGIHQGIWKRI